MGSSARRRPPNRMRQLSTPPKRCTTLAHTTRRRIRSGKTPRHDMPRTPNLHDGRVRVRHPPATPELSSSSSDTGNLDHRIRTRQHRQVLSRERASPKRASPKNLSSSRASTPCGACRLFISSSSKPNTRRWRQTRAAAAAGAATARGDRRRHHLTPPSGCPLAWRSRRRWRSHSRARRPPARGGSTAWSSLASRWAGPHRATRARASRAPATPRPRE